MDTESREPFVTVIMPIRNEEAFISRSLEAVLNQDYPQDRLEILIADGMSDDGTVEKIRNLPGNDRVRIIRNPERIQAAGMNKAILQASGEIILRVDGHTVIAPDYVRQCVSALAATNAQNVGGPMNPIGTTPMGKAIAAAGKSPFAVPTAFHVSQQAQYTDTVYMGAWPRHVLERLGGFNEQFGANEDYELNYRIRKDGGKIYFTPAIQSHYYGRQTLELLAQQYFRYGKSKTRTLRTHPASVRPRHLVAPLFVAGLCLGGVLGLILPLAQFAWLFCILLYCFANLFYSWKTASESGWETLWRLPLVFLTIHLSWGLGFWAGLFRNEMQERLNPAQDVLN